MVMSPLSVLPRVLIIGAVPVAPISATGITLVNLFSGWPSEKIGQLYDDDASPDPTICSQYRRFSSQDIGLVKNAKKILGRFRKRGPVSQSSNHLVNFVPSERNYGFFEACGDIVPIRLPPAIRTWIAEFQPDLIYSVLGNVRMMNVVAQISREFELPIVPHFMDDWPETIYSNSTPLYFHRLILRRRLKKILSLCDRALSIGPDMANEFSERYGVAFDYFMNCVELNDPPAKGTNHSEIVFGFVGGMHLNRWKSLIRIGSVLQDLANLGISVRMEVYSPPKDIQTYGRGLQQFPVVKKIGTLQSSEVDAKLRELDVLIHVESFLKEDSQYTRLSISTKIPQYMASGRPILAIGPRSLSSIQYIDTAEAGLVCSEENNQSLLADLCRNLIESEELRILLGKNGRRTAQKNHDSKLELAKFQDHMIRIARKKSFDPNHQQ